MLEKDFNELVKNYRDTKTQVNELINNEDDLRRYLIENDEEMDDLEKEKLLKEIEGEKKIKVSQSSEEDIMEYEEMMEKANNPTDIEDVICSLEQKMMETNDENEKYVIRKQIKCVKDSVNLSPLFVYSPCVKKTELSKRYDDYLKTAQRKLGSNNYRLFGSSYVIKKVINELVGEELGNKKCKQLASFILSYICNKDVSNNNEGLFIYFLLRNFNHPEKISNDYMELFKSSLIGLYKKL